MKHLTIIVPDGQTTLSTIACITGSYELFATANGYAKRIGKEVYKVEMAGISKTIDFCDGLMTIKPHTSADH